MRTLATRSIELSTQSQMETHVRSKSGSRALARWIACAIASVSVLSLGGCAQFNQVATAVHSSLRNLAVGSYKATPTQVKVASQRAEHHYAKLSPAKKKEMKTKGTRYLAVRTLDPSPAQLAEIKKKAATTPGYSRGGGGGSRTAAKQDWKCVMIWDTYSKEIVGNNCYAVAQLPAQGEVAHFDTYSAEFIGSGGE